MTSNNKIHLILAADNNYAQHMGVAIISVLENSKYKEDLVFHVIENSISKTNVRKIESIATKYKCQINFYKIDIEKTSNFPEYNYMTKASYFRLFIHQLLPSDIEKVIYLDCDIVALGEIKELYDIDVTNYMFAAVEDVKAKRILRNYFYPNLNNYFNAGVLVINLKKWREKIDIEGIYQFVDKYKQEIKNNDQDILNCLFLSDWKQIERKYNYDNRLNFKKLKVDDIILLHYSCRIKPWSYLYTRKEKSHYIKHLKNSPWHDFKYKDRNTKNLLMKYPIHLTRTCKNLLRPIMPMSLIYLKDILFDKYFQDKLK